MKRRSKDGQRWIDCGPRVVAPERHRDDGYTALTLGHFVSLVAPIVYPSRKGKKNKHRLVGHGKAGRPPHHGAIPL
jgi:hypothetical protein